MKKDKQLLPFENILTGYFTEKNFQMLNSVAEMEAKMIFNQPLTVSMPEEVATRMLNALSVELSKPSLGNIVKTSLEEVGLNELQLQEKTGLTPSLIQAIKEDLVFTNSIPVKSLVKLLKLLNLGMDIALASIQVTFEKLQTESKSFVSVPLNIQPSFRKGMIRREIGKELSNLKSDESYLYQNEEALNKYTTRLTELYNTL